MITTTGFHSPTFHHWLLAGLIAAEIVILYGTEIFEINDVNGKSNKLMKLLTSSEPMIEEENLHRYYIIIINFYIIIINRYQQSLLGYYNGRAVLFDVVLIYNYIQSSILC